MNFSKNPNILFTYGAKYVRYKQPVIKITFHLNPSSNKNA